MIVTKTSIELNKTLRTFVFVAYLPWRDASPKNCVLNEHQSATNSATKPRGVRFALPLAAVASPAMQQENYKLSVVLASWQWDGMSVGGGSTSVLSWFTPRGAVTHQSSLSGLKQHKTFLSFYNSSERITNQGVEDHRVLTATACDSVCLFILPWQNMQTFLCTFCRQVWTFPVQNRRLQTGRHLPRDNELWTDEKLMRELLVLPASTAELEVWQAALHCPIAQETKTPQQSLDTFRLLATRGENLLAVRAKVKPRTGLLNDSDPPDGTVHTRH